MRPRVLVLLALASTGFGVGNIITKTLLNGGVAPMAVISGRYLLAIVALLAVLAATGRLRPSGRDAWGRGVVLGVVNMAAPTILSTLGLAYVPASVTAILVALIPLTTVVVAHFVIDAEPMRAAILPGFLLALAGCVLLVRGNTSIGDHTGLGVGLILSGVFAAGWGGALTRRFALGGPVSRLLVPQFVGGGTVALAFALPSGGVADLATFTPTEWGMIVLSSTVATAMPFVALLLLAEVATAAKASLVAYLAPLVGVGGSVLWLNEALTPSLAIGGVLILAGVVMAGRAERRPPLVPV